MATTGKPYSGPSVDLQERTLRVTNLNSKVTKELLYELFNQAGPVVNIVHKPEFAFVEFEHSESVGYALALMNGLTLNGAHLQLQPKLPSGETHKYLQQLQLYESQIAVNPEEWWVRFGDKNEPMPRYLCKEAIRKQEQAVTRLEQSERHSDYPPRDNGYQAYPNPPQYGHNQYYQPQPNQYYQPQPTQYSSPPPSRPAYYPELNHREPDHRYQSGQVDYRHRPGPPNYGHGSGGQHSYHNNRYSPYDRRPTPPSAPYNPYYGHNDHQSSSSNFRHSFDNNNHNGKRYGYGQRNDNRDHYSRRRTSN